jgi:hypothetical protein
MVSPFKGRRITMPWYAPWRDKATPEPAAAVTAAASIVAKPRSPLLKTPDTWQREAWDFFDQLGEFNSGVNWLSQMMSRVRLRAALLDPGLDEPSVSKVPTNSLAAKMLRDLAGGVGGQAQLMRGLVTQLSVPGEGYLVGEQLGVDNFSWMVRSNEEVRASNGHFEVVGNRIPNVEWVPLSSESLVVRVWRPHPRYYHMADSPARSARPIMRELELVNRYIVAQYLSRLAMAGLLIIPEEASFPVREEFADEPDPLSMEFVEIAAESIREPGHASSFVPLLIRVSAEVADKIRHIDFTLKIDEKVIERRESAITRLANKLDVPAEIMTGLGKVNHWTAWQLDEGALKTHIAPMAELICHCLTTGYLQPRLAASGESDVGKWVVWYDMSELAVRPDKSVTAFDAYDRFEISGTALRRETGFGQDDKPSDEELKIQALKALVRDNPGVGAQALDALLGTKLFAALLPAPPGAEAPNGPGAGRPPEKTGVPTPPNTPGPPPKPEKAPEKSPAKQTKAKIAEQTARVVAQSKAMHAVRFSGTRAPVLLHPPLCAENAYGCPYTHAAEEAHLTRLSTGTYESHLDAFGLLTIGQPAPYIDTSDWITTETKILNRRAAGRANGTRVRV